jgi:uncharacterized delta-60 repeat protein
MPNTTPNLKQIVGQLETNIITLTNMDLGEGGYTYTIHRRLNSQTILTDTFLWSEYPYVNWSNYGINNSVEKIYADNYTVQYKITCTDYNSNENAIVTIEATGISASIVTNQGYARDSGFDNDFVEVNLKDYPYYPYAPAYSDGIFKGFNNVVYSTFLQADGKILVGGSFDNYFYYDINNTYTPYLTRLNEDGSPDKTFNILNGFDKKVFTINQQTDGKILVGGEFSNFNGITQSRICRLNEDGSLDTTFDTSNGFNGEGKFGLRSIEIQPDGKILVGGNFNSYNNQTKKGFCRLNKNGSLDNSFSIGYGFNDQVEIIKYLSIGKILVGGKFGIYNESSSSGLILLNLDGSIDTTFTLNGDVISIEEQTDGRILIGGSFTSFNGSDTGNLIRLLPYSHWGFKIIDQLFNNGSKSPGFNSSVFTIKQQSDGKILVGGYFSQYYDPNYGNFTSNYIMRLNYNGSVDRTFNEGNEYISLNGGVRTISIQSDNKIIVGGEFDNYSQYLVRLYSGLEPEYFSPKFMGETYDKIAVGSNSYLTFGGGSERAYNTGTLPGIFISEDDRSYQRVWVGIDHLNDLGGFAFKVRYEGGQYSSLNMKNSPQIEWEICFLDQNIYDIGTIDIRIGTNDAWYGPNYYNSYIKGTNFIAKYFEAKPHSSFLLPNGWGQKQNKLDSIKFNPGTTINNDYYGTNQVNLPVASADWTNNNGNIWGIRTYNGGLQTTLSSANPQSWFYFENIPEYNGDTNNLRGGIIEYHAFVSGFCNGTIIGSMTFVIDSNNSTNIVHTEVTSGTNLGNIILWNENDLYNKNGSIQAQDTSGGTTDLMIQWTSRLFFGHEVLNQ